MKLIKVVMVSIVMLVICSQLSYGFVVDTYDISVRVIDDNGTPVDNAEVFISFEKNTTSGTRMYAQKGISNVEGRFSASGSGNGHITYGATKSGFYDSHYSYSFASYETQSKDYSLKQDFVILLRKIVKPVPMYARQGRIEIPVIGTDIGFDLEKFDWVAPYGIGMQSDFIFNLERLPVETRQNYSAALTIKFSNSKDGIQKYHELLNNGSEFKLPRIAPENGYEPILILKESFTATGPVNLNFNFREKDLNYLFRVRSIEKNGKLIQSTYGKIRGQIDFTAIRSKTGKIYFDYYLNPDHTRNLEFDTKSNLFINLPVLDQMNVP